MVGKVDANSNILFVLLEPHSSFWSQYQLLTMTTFFEIAVYEECHTCSIVIFKLRICTVASTKRKLELHKNKIKNFYQTYSLIERKVSQIISFGAVDRYKLYAFMCV